MSFFSNKIEKLLSVKGIKSANELAVKYLGYPNSEKINRLKKEGNKPSYDLLQDICRVFPDVSMDWLLKDTSNIFDERVPNELGINIASEPSSEYITKSTARFIDVDDQNVITVPLVGQYAYAGYLSGFSDPEYIGELPKIPFIVDKEYKGKYLAFEVRGDSMDDGTKHGYESGSVLLCREIQRHHWRNKLHINQWDFVIVHKTEGILIKRIVKHDVDSGMLTLHSLNELYEDLTVHLDDVMQIFNVIKEVSDKKR